MAESSNPAEDFLLGGSYQASEVLDRQPGRQPPFWKTFFEAVAQGRAPGPGGRSEPGRRPWLESAGVASR